MAITPESIEFGRRLRAARAYGRPDGEITKEELAEATDYNRATIAAWERGEAPSKRGVRRGMIETVCDLTGLPPEFFSLDFTELGKAMEERPDLNLDWISDQEVEVTYPYSNPCNE